MVDMTYTPRARVRALGLAAALAAGAVACGQDAPRPAARVELVPAPVTDDVAALVARELATAERDQRRLVVYVGATWCEPCRYFHDAAASGALDATFGGLRLLEFDADRDAAALQRAGYVAAMIPLFAVPRPDGTASGKQIEGSIKGAGAVAQITPRLRALLQP